MAILTETKAWQSLQAHSSRFQRPDFKLADLVGTQSGRFAEFSLQVDNLLLDFSKNVLTAETFDLLLQLAEQQRVPAAITAMYAGDTINGSEQRSALHIALREPPRSARFTEVAETLQHIDDLVTAVLAGDHCGYSGEALTDIVNLGVGGSDLGPALVVSALHHVRETRLNVHFVSNIDPLHLQSTLSGLNPATTLFIVASKSFTTLETLHNANTARNWLLARAPDEDAVARHFLAVTSNQQAAIAFGIKPNHILPMWDWVGGRFSLWSAIGLPIAFAQGMGKFRELLSGAHAMDEHFQNAPLKKNMPVILALLSVWYRGFFASHSSVVIPYSQALKLLPAFLQQLSMESLGKSVTSADETVRYHTGEPVWGAAGTDVQHSCFQMLHQGTNFIPVDFIVAARASTDNDTEAHQHLLANCLSQSLALMQGSVDNSNPCRNVPGNRPSNTLLLRELNAYNLGSLLALYEHKTYVQSVLWNINAFDQWGVQLGKTLSHELFAIIQGANAATISTTMMDDSTANLLDFLENWK